MNEPDDVKGPGGMTGPGESRPEGTTEDETMSDARWRAALRDMDTLLRAASAEWPTGAERGIPTIELQRETLDAAGAREPVGEPIGGPVGGPAPRTGRSHWLWLLAPAAVVAGLLLRPQDPTPMERATAPVTASLEVETSRPFVVLETDNPRIAVVWLLEEPS